jgi:hypothetical protein
VESLSAAAAMREIGRLFMRDSITFSTTKATAKIAVSE